MSTDVNKLIPWEKIEPPFWWPKIKDHVIADRHLPDGTRQHMIRGHVEPGRVVANAQIVGQEDCPDAIYAPAQFINQKEGN